MQAVVYLLCQGVDQLLVDFVLLKKRYVITLVLERFCHIANFLILFSVFGVLDYTNIHAIVKDANDALILPGCDFYIFDQFGKMLIGKDILFL